MKCENNKQTRYREKLCNEKKKGNKKWKEFSIHNIQIWSKKKIYFHIKNNIYCIYKYDLLYLDLYNILYMKLYVQYIKKKEVQYIQTYRKFLSIHFYLIVLYCLSIFF